MNRLRTSGYALATLAISLGALAGSNQPTTPCGSFSVTKSGHSAGGARCALDFTFTPSACSAACTCSKIAYLQIIRVRDVDRNEYIQPFQQQVDRMIESSTPQLNGWAVDRRANNDWGYFGALNGDPITFSSSRLEPGSNGSPVKHAVMKDRPERWPKRAQFEAVSVPVCMDSTASCSSKLLAYQHWSFQVRNDGSGTAPSTRTATHWEREAVDLAVGLWDEDATAPMIALGDLKALQQLP
jgi:hypothetical protein